MQYSFSTIAMIGLSLTGSVFADHCSDACTASHNKCVTTPGSNKATCAADFAACLGYNPYEKQPFVQPTACHGASNHTEPIVNSCAATCEVLKNKCLTTPESNKSTCVSDYRACASHCSGSNTITHPSNCTICSTTTSTGVVPPVVTAAGDRVQPVLGLLIALVGALL